MGLQLLIPRLLGAISGHMAYSGYFGYFIGLAALRPDYRWRVLSVGYLTAALLHALWNTMGAVSPLLLALSGMLSYGCLAAAILKARSLSPTRAQNFATQFKR
jgi:RsiW-degrading membrane proteinase PrsW (M82 family)